MKNVSIVVLALITSGHVSLKWTTGPITAQATIISITITKNQVCPDALAIFFANRPRRLVKYMAVSMSQQL